MTAHAYVASVNILVHMLVLMPVLISQVWTRLKRSRSKSSNNSSFLMDISKESDRKLQDKLPVLSSYGKKNSDVTSESAL